MRVFRRLCAVLATLLLLLLTASSANAHDERRATFPEGLDQVPDLRTTGPTLVVCKPDTAERVVGLPLALRIRHERLLRDCAFEHIQDAVAAVEQAGTRILVLPGTYREEPYVGLVPDACVELAQRPPGDGSDVGAIPAPAGQDQGDNARGTPVFSYEEQRACPHLQNLIGIFGDTDSDGRCDNALCDLQIEGTGARPTDVIVDGQYKVLNGIRGDRADGLYLRNLTVQRFEFNAVYVLESDGFVFDDVVTRWNDEYGFLSFAVDHGLYQNCEAYGNGDSGAYPGSASDLNQGEGLFDDNEGLRFATEIRGCRSHHNAIGYSGTAGNSVHTHHNEFDGNATGASMDSLFPDHPGLPQDHSYFHDNLFHSNNTNYYHYVNEGVCSGPFAGRDYDEGVVCPVIPLPVGTGALIAGGNYNLFERNRFYDNWRQGLLLFFVPAELRGEHDPLLQFDTSNFNTTRDNRMADNPAGHVQPNGVDFWWDGEGEGNCWSDNTSAAGAVTNQIGDAPTAALPGCDPRPPFSPAVTIVRDGPCALYNRDDQATPEGCDWMADQRPPGGREPSAPVLQRVVGEGRIQTAIAAAREGYPDRAESVVLARADQYPDALAGAPLAAANGGPVLLTNGDQLSADTAAEIRRLGATRVLLLGGEAALAPAVERAVRELGVDDVTRVGGADRFETAIQIARLVGGANGYVAKGADADPERAWPDALAASAVAAFQQRPILLTAGAQLPGPVAAFLAEGDLTDVQIVGGPDAVSESVAEELRGALDDVDRIGGADRYETSRLLAAAAVRAGADPTELWLATGTNWPDALVAGSAVSVDEGVLLLVDPVELGPSTPAAGWVDEHRSVLENARVLGGPEAVSPAVFDALERDHGMVPGDARGDRSSHNLVTSGEFRPLDGAPAQFQAVTGTARMVRTIQGTTEVEVLMRGLPTAAASYPTHVHDRTCDEGGGNHFRFDAAGLSTPPNEIHPTVEGDDVGVGLGADTAFAVAGPAARSVVLHAPSGEKVACADLSGADISAAGTPLLTAGFLASPDATAEVPDGVVALVALGGVGLAALAVERRRRAGA